MNNEVLSRTAEYFDVTAATFHNEVVPRNRPAILRRLVAHWPAVDSARHSAEALSGYLRRFDIGSPIETLTGEPSIGGRLFYSDDLRSFNFTKKSELFGAFMERLLNYRADENPPAMFVQSAPIPVHLPKFDQENSNPLLGTEIPPRIWIGNSITVTTHSDLASNIACLIAGQRRFTFFPPEQLKNLYIGPFEFTPAGQPISMVNLDAPDLTRYPRFAEALASAQVAELEAGDAVYIPYYWWHHVRSLESFNVLVNYWWNDGDSAQSGTPYESLMLALLTIRDLPPAQRDVWRTIFDHYVFLLDGDPGAHLPPDRRGALGSLTPQHRAHIKSVVARVLSRPQ